MKNIAFPIIATGALLLAGASLVRHLPEGELTEAPSPPPESPFPERVAAVGLVEASTENIAVGTRIAGIVHQVFVSAGQRVNTGEPLFEIDNRHLGAQLELHRAALAVAERSSRTKTPLAGDIAPLSTYFEGTIVDSSGNALAIRHKAIEVLPVNPTVAGS
jgi:multidrug efflux pump subunit AcrA (membrane-fusion protein)